MSGVLYLVLIFFAKVLDNALSTAKTILIQRNRWLFAGIAVVVSDFLYFWMIKKVVAADSIVAIIVVAVAGGVGCAVACLISDRLLEEKLNVHVIYADEPRNLKELQESFKEMHILTVVTECYLDDWNEKKATMIAYPKTKRQEQWIKSFYTHCPRNHECMNCLNKER